MGSGSPSGTPPVASTPPSTSSTPTPSSRSRASYQGDPPNSFFANQHTTTTNNSNNSASTSLSSSRAQSPTLAPTLHLSQPQSAAIHAHRKSNSGSGYRHSSPLSTPPLPLMPPASSASQQSTLRQSPSQEQLNIQLNNLTSGSTGGGGSSYPTIPRFNRGIPTRSAPSSPPGTPPNGLSAVYVNAAYNRSHAHFPKLSLAAHGGGDGSRTGGGDRSLTSSPSLRPQIIIPGSGSNSKRNSLQLLPPPAMLRTHSGTDLSAMPSSTNTLHQLPSQQQQSRRQQLKVEEPEILVTSPGGTNNPDESHVISLHRALSNLIEAESEGHHEFHGEPDDDDDRDDDNDDDNLLEESEKEKKKKNKTKSTSVAVTSGTGSSSGSASAAAAATSLDPTQPISLGSILFTEPQSTITTTATSVPAAEDPLALSTLVPRTSTMVSASQVPTAPLTAAKEKERKGARKRVAKLFRREIPKTVTAPLDHPMAAQLARQPTKSGVLSNLLKLQNAHKPSGTHHEKKGRSGTATDRDRERLEKEQRRLEREKEKEKEKEAKKLRKPKMYDRSTNNSTHSVHRSSIFTTYPPLPNTSIVNSLGPNNNNVGNSGNYTLGPNTAAMLAGLGSQSNNNTIGYSTGPGGTNNSGQGMGRKRNSFAFDTFTPLISAFNSPNGSPTMSPRGSVSNDLYTAQVNNNNNYHVGGAVTPNGGGSSTMEDMLSAEEQMMITFAVADILQRQDYILRLARAMIKYGAPSHRLETSIDQSAKILELNLQCIYLPNVMIIAFTDYETHTSETHLLKVSAGLDMYRFAQVHQVMKAVTHQTMSVDQGIMNLEAINLEKDIIPRWAIILCYATASFCSAPMFFGGGWVEAGFGLVLGTCVGLMSWLAERVPGYSNICEVTMSVLVAFVAEASHSVICRSPVKMSGVVMLLPGYTITCAILELSSRHIISGSVRLLYAFIFSLLLGYGLTIGASFWILFDPTAAQTEESITAACPTDLPPIWNILFVPLFAISLNIWLKAHPRQWPFSVFLSIMGYGVSYSTAVYAGAKSEVSSALAAFAIGFVGSLYQRLTHQLSFQAVVCAVFFLVPGSLGLKGSLALFTYDMTGGAAFALQMIVVSIAIAVGLFFSSLIVYPTGKAHSVQMTF